MRIQDLAATDFPDVDRKKFEEWKGLLLQLNRNPLIAFAILIIGYVVLVPLIGGAIGWGLPVVAVFGYLISRLPKKFRYSKLSQELGIQQRLKELNENRQNRQS